MREEEDNIIGYIEYLSDDGKIIGYVTPFTDVDKFRKEILKAAEVGMPITPVVFPDKLDKSLGLPRDIYWPGGFRKEKMCIRDRYREHIRSHGDFIQTIFSTAGRQRFRL